MNAPDLLEISPDRRLAYHRTAARGDGKAAPGVVFLGGFRSDMTGTKAVWLEDWARERGRAFLRFDYRGHGASSGGFLDGAIGDWADDAAEAVTRLTEGPQILVGSSMGGWIALLLARRMPGRVAALVGIAAAPDFTEDSMWAGFDTEARAALLRDGRVELPSDYSDEPYVITRRLIEEGRNNLVLRDPLPLPFPVRLLQGTADTDVPPEVALRLLGHVDCPDARLTLVKGADHRFSGPRELAILGATLDEVTGAISQGL
ncbi:alpha/beta hydrolase [Limibaculum sp. FT325]|uniref:alpha/beta fold hydrolase n=1 Tax=Thermohalobaculum sediminis TaxID=2939436 RepID=UPI0020C123F4|nr:alpha/beta hydrolase [Limibaculum sediminis]MCL5776586.1 alpha/beta hydrolase [Limibaculum sediminis]